MYACSGVVSAEVPPWWHYVRVVAGNNVVYGEYGGVPVICVSVCVCVFAGSWLRKMCIESAVGVLVYTCVYVLHVRRVVRNATTKKQNSISAVAHSWHECVG